MTGAATAARAAPLAVKVNHPQGPGPKNDPKRPGRPSKTQQTTTRSRAKASLSWVKAVGAAGEWRVSGEMDQSGETCDCVEFKVVTLDGRKKAWYGTLVGSYFVLHKQIENITGREQDGIYSRKCGQSPTDTASGRKRKTSRRRGAVCTW